MKCRWAEHVFRSKTVGSFGARPSLFLKKHEEADDPGSSGRPYHWLVAFQTTGEFRVHLETTDFYVKETGVMRRGRSLKKLVNKTKK